MDPMTTRRCCGMGVTRFYQGRVPEAIEYAQAAIRSQPDAPKAHDQLGMALAKQNRERSRAR